MKCAGVPAVGSRMLPLAAMHSSAPGWKSRWRRATLSLAVLVASTATTPALVGTNDASANDAAGRLPLGDGLVSGKPLRGHLYACRSAASVPATASPAPWISGRKYLPTLIPRVNGSVKWPEGRFTLRGGTKRVTFVGNGLPTTRATGAFPIAPSDDAFQFAEPGLALIRHRVSGSFSARPRAAERASCIDHQPVGISLDGVPILPALDAQGRDAVAREVRDRCGGRPSRTGHYYLRLPIRCSPQSSQRDRHSRLIGYARDGFSIFGRRGKAGKVLHNEDLDRCHGHNHRVAVGGRKIRAYHYHRTASFPYVLGCFRGRPAASWKAVPEPQSFKDNGDKLPGEGSPEAPILPPPSISPAIPPPSITSEPPLYPPFSDGVQDYVTRCNGDDPVRLDVQSNPGQSVAVDGRPAEGGAFSTSVDLSPNHAFSIETNSGGQPRAYFVRCLAVDFPKWTFTRTGEPSQEWYVVTPTIGDGAKPFIAIFDGNGVPVWWYRAALPPIDGKVMPNGHIAWARWYSRPFGVSPDQAYEEHRLDGSLARTITAVGTPTDQHDMVRTPQGTDMLLSYVPRDGVDLSAWGGPSDATVLDTVIQEVSTEGKLLWSWNSKDHVALSESERLFSPLIISQPSTLPDGRTVYDIVHANAIEPLEDGSLLLSLRHTDAVYKINRSAGSIEWKLGGTTTDQSLAILADEHGSYPLQGPHDVRTIDDGTVTVHDNGAFSPRAPRAVRYRVDPDARTATLVEQVRDPRVSSANCCGSSRKLRGGGWLLAWGNNDLVTEFDRNGTRVFSLTFGGPFSYRAFPVPTGTLDRAELRQGMNAMAEISP